MLFFIIQKQVIIKGIKKLKIHKIIKNKFVKESFILEYLLKTTLIGLFFGTFGTTLGGIIGVAFKNTSNKFLSFILSMASRTYGINSVL